MGQTTVLRNLAGEPVRSETQFRRVQAEALRTRGLAGDESWARMHEQAILDIRAGLRDGGSLDHRLCPDCMKRRVRTLVLDIGESRRCGTCGWTAAAS